MSQTTGMLRRIGQRARANGAPWAVGFFAATAFVAAVVVIQAWPSPRFEQDTAATWVVRAGEVGRLNTEVGEIDVRLTPFRDGATVDAVVQHGGERNGRAVAVAVGADRDGVRALAVLDAGVTAGEGSAEPVTVPGDAAVAGGGGRLAVLTGDGLEVRTDPEASSAPLEVRGGPGALLAVGHDGTVGVLSPGLIEVVAPGASEAERLEVPEGNPVALTFVGDRPVAVVDGPRRLVVPGGAEAPLDRAALVQQPGPSADEVIVATPRGLDAIDLDSGTARRLDVAGSGDPLRPAVDDRCVLGAWSQGGAWADCGDGPTVEPAAGGTQFRTGGPAAVLSTPDDGLSWLVDPDGRWRRVEWPQDREQDPTDRTDEFEVRQPPSDQKPPVAQDDLGSDEIDGGFRSRPGRVNRLDVLKNDYDPNGDPIIVTGVEPSDAGLVVSPDGRAVLYEPPSGAGGIVRFSYVVSDGSGSAGTDTAEAEVEVVTDPNDNRAPRRRGAPVSASVAVEQRVDVDVLSNYWDPDADPMYLKSAQAPATSSHRVEVDPAGWFSLAAGKQVGDVGVTYEVSDARAPVANTALISVRDDLGGFPPITKNDVFVIRENSGADLRPLDNDRDPAGPGDGSSLRLDGLPEWDGGRAPGTITPVGERSFRVEAAQLGEYAASYRAVGAPGNPSPATRIVVRVVGDQDQAPVARNDVVLVQAGRSAEVDLLRNDLDPAGQLLSVTDLAPLDEPPPGFTGSVGGDFRTFRIDTDASIREGATAQFRYTVNTTVGSQSASATVLVVVVPAVESQPVDLKPPPVVVPAGGVGTLRLAELVRDADGDPLTFSPAGPLPAGAHLGGDSIRFVAADGFAGRVEVRLVVSDTDSNRIEVTGAFDVVARPPTNSRPTPPDVEVRVLESGRADVALPLNGVRPPVDPDGDTVQLVGLAPAGPGAAATRGLVKVDEPRQVLSYEAPASPGPDVFGYQVTDGNGGFGTAVVRVAVLPLSGNNRDPVARPDRVTAAPGATVVIDPLANDADLDGDLLVLSDERLDSTCEGELRPSPPGVPGARVAVVAPSESGGTCVFYYRVVDPTGRRDLGQIEVVARDGFPGLPPIARDDVVPATAPDGVAILDVRANDLDPDGDVNALVVTFPDGGAEPVEGGHRFTLADEPQRLRYVITDGTQESSAFVWVPGRSRPRPPSPRADAPVVRVKVKAPPQSVQVLDYLVDDGRIEEYRLSSSPSELKVELSREGSLTLEAVASAKPGRIVVGIDVVDDQRLSARIDVPVEVIAADNQPPVWKGSPCGTVERNGSPTTVPLDVRLVDLDEPGTPNATLTVTATSSDPALQVRPEGATAVTFQAGDMKEGFVDVTLVASDGGSPRLQAEYKCRVEVKDNPLPPPTVRTLQAQVNQGESVSVEVRREDLISFSSGAYEVVAPVVETDDAGEVTLQPGNRLTFTANAAFSGKAVIRFTVREVTDPEDPAQGTFEVEVLGRPSDIVAPPTLTTSKPRALVVSWDAPAANNSPITDYIVQPDNGAPATVCTAPRTTCEVTNGIRNGVSYTVTVTARNAVGDALNPSPASNPITPDQPPKPPSVTVSEPWKTGTFADGEQTEVTVTWAETDAAAGVLDRTPLTKAVLLVDGQERQNLELRRSVQVKLPNGRPSRVAIRISNDKDSAIGEAPAPVVPVGRPLIDQFAQVRSSEGGKVVLEATVRSNSSAPTVSWAVAECNQGQDVARSGEPFQVELICPSTVTTVTLTATGTVEEQTSSGNQPTSQRTAAVTPLNPPTITGALQATATAGQVRIKLPPVDDNGPFKVDRWRYTIDGRSAAEAPPGKDIVVDLPGVFGERSITVQACNSDVSCSDPVTAPVYLYDGPGPFTLTAARDVNDPTTAEVLISGWTPPDQNPANWVIGWSVRGLLFEPVPVPVGQPFSIPGLDSNKDVEVTALIVWNGRGATGAANEQTERTVTLPKVQGQPGGPGPSGPN